MDKKSLRGIFGFLAVIAVWTGINWWMTGNNIKTECNKEPGISEAFCDCVTKKGRAEIGILPLVPIVGRIMGPDEAKERQIGMKVAGQCLAEEL